MKRIILVCLALAALLGLTTTSVAQAFAAPELTGSLKVSPASGGTKKKPKNGLLNVTFNINEESNSTLSRIEYKVPSNIKLDGTGFKTCTADQINMSGESVCPKGSQVGTGAASALLGPNKAPLNFDVNVYVAGKKSLTLFLKTSLFTIAIPATISGQTVAFDIPERVQSPVSGLYSYVTSVTANLGKQAGISGATKMKQGGKKVTKYFASLKGCPTSKAHTGGVKAFLAANPSPPQVPFVGASVSIPCK